MKTYVIGFDAADSDNVLELIRDFSNDIIIDHIETDNVKITIELDDVEADALYENLREEILRHTEMNWMI